MPPDTGIVHQVNLEYLARVVMSADSPEGTVCFPDTLVGTDSHTTMVNGLGVMGWGVGGIEAEAAMLGQPISMLIPQVLGFRLTGAMLEGATATDLVLTITERLRKHGVVGKFVEFFGPGLEDLTIADRATLGNMCPEYGATIAIFPIDAMTLDYLRLTGRERVAGRAGRGLRQGAGDVPQRRRSRSDLHRDDRARSRVRRAEPRRAAAAAGSRVAEAGEEQLPGRAAVDDGLVVEEGRRGGGLVARVGDDRRRVRRGGRGAGDRHRARSRRGRDCRDHQLHQHVESQRDDRRRPGREEGGRARADAAAVGEDEPGARDRKWSPSTSRKSGLDVYLDALGFNLVGYGCTTCIGNSGPLPEDVSAEVEARNLVVASVLSGNRNFEGRIQQQVRANYLASPPLVVAYALAGRMTLDLTTEPIGIDKNGVPVYLRELWPTEREIQETMLTSVTSAMFREQYADVFSGDERWKQLQVPTGDRFAWDPDSTYIRNPPFFENITMETSPVRDITGARVLALLGDSITTDHISPAGSIKKDSPAGKYLMAHGVQPTDFNSYGARRGNHEVMMRGTFANIRLRNQLAPGTEGGWTTHQPDGEVMTIYDAAMKYKDEGVPLLVIAGKEYGSGSSRDWAAKGTLLLGVVAVIAESFERIHRSNLVNMGVLPLQFQAGATAASLGLTGRERYELTGIAQGLKPGGLDHRARASATTAADRVPGGGAHRHAGGAGRVPARRHPAVRAAPARRQDVTLGCEP